MRKFLVTASSVICRDGQYVNFKELKELGKTEVDTSSSDPEWYNFEGEFVLDACVKALTEEEAISTVSKDYEIEEEYLMAYELK